MGEVPREKTYEGEAGMRPGGVVGRMRRRNWGWEGVRGRGRRKGEGVVFEVEERGEDLVLIIVWLVNGA